MSQAIPASSYFNELGLAPAGVVSSSSTTSFTAVRTNSRQWLLQSYPTSGTSILTSPLYDHDYFWNLYRGQVRTTVTKNDITNGDLQVAGSSDPEILAIHPASGNTVTLKTPGNINGSKLTIAFVNHTDGVTPVNFVVDSNVQVDSTSFIIFIVSGNVTISSSVSRADGYYLSTGSYNSSTGQTQLLVSGGVAAYGGVNFGRRMADPNVPAEVLTYNPLIVKFAPRIGESSYSWVEVAP